jgi:cysteine desulfurase family protein (TIGR01976 family)
MLFNQHLVRSQFPALSSEAIFFDNPGGTQITRRAMDQMTSYLSKHNANHGGAFSTSITSDHILDEARAACADFVNADRPDEIVFGNNMTTLTLNMSRSISRNWKPGDEIILTRLDHDANLTPWALAAEERDVKVNYLDFDPETGTLKLDDLPEFLEHQPKLIALGYASNALGTINPVKEITELAHNAGAIVYVDAVQFAPHGIIDVQDLNCDFLVCSAYKIFGPHAGFLYGKYRVLEDLFPYKVRPASPHPPGKFETGTQNHEGIAGILGAIEYLEWIGSQFGVSYERVFGNYYSGRKLRLKQAMAAIHAGENPLSSQMLAVLNETPGLTLYGLRDLSRIDDRVPTYAFRLEGWHPRRFAEVLADENIYVWDGNFYAPSVTNRLGIEESGGLLRVGLVHYNTDEEVNRFAEILQKLAIKPN